MHRKEGRGGGGGGGAPAAAPDTVPGGGTMRQRQQRQQRQQRRMKKSVYRNDAFGSHGHTKHIKKSVNYESLTYVTDESDTWRGHWAQEHFVHRGEFWNAGKHSTTRSYVLITLIGIVQACVAYSTNISSKHFIEVCVYFVSFFCVFMFMFVFFCEGVPLTVPFCFQWYIPPISYVYLLVYWFRTNLKVSGR